MDLDFISATPGPECRYSENFYFDPEYNGLPALVGTPGLITLIDFGYIGEGRGAFIFNDKLYVVYGSNLYVVNKSYEYTLIGTLSTTTGRVWMDKNTTQLMLVDGTYLYIYDPDTGTLTNVYAASSGVYQDEFFIFTYPNSRSYYITSREDGLTVDASQVMTVSGRSDNLQAVLSLGEILFFLGDRSGEAWYYSGDTYPFARIQEGVFDIGTISPATLIHADNSAWWLSNNKQLIRTDAYSPKIISSEDIDEEIAGYSTVTDASSFSYTQAGHTFIVWNFPTADRTWCYDCKTDKFHRRCSGVDGGRWRVNAYVYWASEGKHIGLDYENGKLYEISTSTYQEDGEPIKSVRTAPILSSPGRRLFFPPMVIGLDMGNPPSGEEYSTVALDWSEDPNLMIWSNKHYASLGATGEYKKIAKWERLGSSENGRSFRVTITDNVKRVIRYAKFLGDNS